MEIIRGKKPTFIGTSELAQVTSTYQCIHIDIGTGDGRYVRHIAKQNSNTFVIGVDACRENLYTAARRAPTNVLFVIANAYNLPSELSGLASHITINFPWGSLMNGLIRQDATLLESIRSITQSGATIDVVLNGGAVREAGYELDSGARLVRSGLIHAGFNMHQPVTLTDRDLKTYPTTWAKRLAFGRDPRAVYLCGIKP